MVRPERRVFPNAEGRYSLLWLCILLSLAIIASSACTLGPSQRHRPGHDSGNEFLVVEVWKGRTVLVENPSRRVRQPYKRVMGVGPHQFAVFSFSLESVEPCADRVSLVMYPADGDAPGEIHGLSAYAGSPSLQGLFNASEKFPFYLLLDNRPRADAKQLRGRIEFDVTETYTLWVSGTRFPSGSKVRKPTAIFLAVRPRSVDLTEDWRTRFSRRDGSFAELVFARNPSASHPSSSPGFTIRDAECSIPNH